MEELPNPPGGPEPLQQILDREGTLDDDGHLQLPVDLVSKLCRERMKKEKTLHIEFAPPNRTCDWGQNGNLPARNYFFQARIEQRAFLDIPEGAIPCTADFNFPLQTFLYDDQFVFSMNRSIFAASLTSQNISKRAPTGLLNYNWDNIAGTPWDFDKRASLLPTNSWRHGGVRLPRPRSTRKY